MNGTITVGRVNRAVPGVENIRIDRQSPLGNPFYMRDERQRDEVCYKYEKYFRRKVLEPGAFREEVSRIYHLVENGQSVNLQCWCAPKRCHGETIKTFIEEYLQ